MDAEEWVAAGYNNELSFEGIKHPFSVVVTETMRSVDGEK